MRMCTCTPEYDVFTSVATKALQEIIDERKSIHKQLIRSITFLREHMLNLPLGRLISLHKRFTCALKQRLDSTLEVTKHFKSSILRFPVLLQDRWVQELLEDIEKELGRQAELYSLIRAFKLIPGR